VRKLIEGAGGKLVNFYYTTGDADFLLITETDEAESIIATLLVAAAAGTISDVTTSRAWTGREFKSVVDKASKAAKLYRPPGKRWLCEDNAAINVAIGVKRTWPIALQMSALLTQSGHQ
jgi:uncharacterized protein with GYD domain